MVEYNDTQLQANAIFSSYYDNNWYFDSGVFIHVRRQKASLKLVNDNYLGHNITTVEGISSTSISSNSSAINLNHVLYVHVLYSKFISIGSLVDKG